MDWPVEIKMEKRVPGKNSSAPSMERNETTWPFSPEKGVDGARPPLGRLELGWSPCNGGGSFGVRRHKITTGPFKHFPPFLLINCGTAMKLKKPSRSYLGLGIFPTRVGRGSSSGPPSFSFTKWLLPPKRGKRGGGGGTPYAIFLERTIV